jgi:ribosomal protein L31
MVQWGSSILPQGSAEMNPLLNMELKMHKTLEAITCHTCGKAELKESSFCSDATLEQYVCSDCHDKYYSDSKDRVTTRTEVESLVTEFIEKNKLDAFYGKDIEGIFEVKFAVTEVSQESVETLPEREELEEQHGQVWNTKELQQDFTVQGFASPCVVVTRKSDGVKGTLEFIHQPRFYFDFVAG